MSTANYKVQDNEKHLFHIRFTKIVKDGKRTKDTYIVQKFEVREWEKMKKFIDEHGLAGATQFDEISAILHDPTKPEPKPQTSKTANKAKTKEE